MATININPTLRKRLKQVAADREVSIQFISETAIADFLGKLTNGAKDKVKRKPHVVTDEGKAA